MMKRFQFSPLGKELKAQTDIAKKQYQKLDDIDEFVKIKKEIPTIKNYKRSDLIFDNRHKKKCTCNLNAQKESIKERKVSVYDNTSELYNEYLGVYYD